MSGVVMRRLGHPVHPMLVHFPIAFWSLGTACDGLTLLGLHEMWTHAWLFLAIGLATAVPAMIAGAFDFARLGAEAVSVGTRHMAFMGIAWSAYLAAFITRGDGWAPLAQPELPAIVLSAAGFVLMAAGGRYGGHLVYRLGAGAEHTPGRE